MPLKVSDGIGSWIKDFQKSDAPQFKGKSDKDRRDQAIAAYLSAKRGKNEEVDPIQWPSQPLDEKVDREALAKAMAVYKARGGKVTKAPAAKAQGYHGKDDPGAGMHGMLDKPDTKKIGTRKKVKSMEGVEEELQVYRVGHKSVGGNVHAKSHDDAMAKLRAKGVKGKITLTHRGAAKNVIPSHSKTGKPMAATNEAKQTHVFDNEKDARAKAKEIGGKYVKGTGKSDGKHAAIKTEGKNDARVDHEAAMQGHHMAAKSARQDLRAVEAHKRAAKHHHDAIKHIDNNDHAAANKSLASAKAAASVAKKYGGKISSDAHDDTHAVKSSYNEGYGGTSFSMKAMSKMKPQEKEKPPFDNAKPVNKDPRDKFGNPIKNRARSLARAAARKLVSGKNESSYDKLNQYAKDAQTSKDRATNSAVATILRKGDHSKDLNTMRKRERGLKMVRSRITDKIRKGDKK